MAIHTYTGNSKQQLSPSGASNAPLELTPAELQQTLDLAGLLQTSLEINNILQYFIDATRARVEFDGVQFDYEAMDIALSFGHQKRHTCSYRLRLADEFLGELSFNRKRRFSSQEMDQLENMLCHLVYPLRNAIWYQRAVKAAHVDPLTGINNRNAMDTTLTREVELAHRNKTPLSLIVTDIDHFKAVNDQYGHSTGDEVLKTFANVLSEHLRSSDIMFRFGGEEFLILLTGTDRDGAFFVAERLREAVAEASFTHNGTPISLTASLGTASLSNQDDPDSLFEKADAALYQAKQSGRNQVVCHSAEPQRKKA